MDQLPELFKRSFQDPRGAAAEVIRLGIRREVLWMALVLVALLNAILYALVFQFSAGEVPAGLPPEEAAMLQFYVDMSRRPIILTLILASSLTLSVFFLTWIGGIIGGAGNLRDVLSVVTLWQFIGLAVSVVMLLVGLVALPVANLASFIVNIWLLYMLCAMLAEAHRFSSTAMGLLTIVLSVLVVAVGLTVVIVMFGAAAGAGVAHV